MTDSPPCDSGADILAHILPARDRLGIFTAELLHRGLVHGVIARTLANAPGRWPRPDYVGTRIAGGS